MKKKTAVEFYREKLRELVALGGTYIQIEEEIFDQAKAMEKEQIIDCFLDGQDNGWQFEGSNEAQAESYYNETFNTDIL